MLKVCQILVVCCILSCPSLASASLGDIYQTIVTSPNKQKVNLALTEGKASLEERALVLAIASIETENFAVDYPSGDNKTGDAYNVSIYKLNVGLVKKLTTTSPQILHTDVRKATLVVLNGIRTLGCHSFLTNNRGGAGAFTGKVPMNDINPYIEGIKKLQQLYLDNPSFMFNDKRFTIEVKPI
jgi:hypothetical protein